MGSVTLFTAVEDFEGARPPLNVCFSEISLLCARFENSFQYLFTLQYNIVACHKFGVQ